MDSLGWFIMSCVLITVASCSVGFQKEQDRTTSKICYEQTKDIKCWSK